MRYLLVMKKLFVCLFVLLPTMAMAYDFSLAVPSGQTLYFNYVEGGVEVTYPNSGSSMVNAWNGYTKPTGAIVIPSSVTYQGIVYQVKSVGPFALYGCNSHTSLVISEGITSLGNSAFSHNTAMTMASVPASVTSVGSQTFGNCDALSDVWIYASVPPTTATGAFFQTDLTSSTLHVNCGSDSIYGTTAPWSSFGTIVSMPCMVTISTAVNDPTRGSVTGGDSYAYGAQAVLAAQPATGYAFICWNDGNTQNPRALVAEQDVTLTAMFYALIHDTIELHDTTVVHDTIYDTIHVTDALNLIDTVYVTDTVHVTDTIPLTYYQLQVLSDNNALGVGVGSARLLAGSEVEICALPLEGGRFLNWSDGVSDNPRRVVVNADRTLTAQFDRLGIPPVTSPGWHVSVSDRLLTVENVKGERVRLYDTAGRLVEEVQSVGNDVFVTVRSAGVYIVRVGEFGAQKVVIE